MEPTRVLRLLVADQLRARSCKACGRAGKCAVHRELLPAPLRLLDRALRRAA